MNDLKITFEYQGAERTLAKHPGIYVALKRGEITAEQASAAPWYLRFRVQGTAKVFRLGPKKGKPLNEAEAIRAAKDLLKSQTTRAGDFAEFLAARDARQHVTIGGLAQDWFAAGLPFSTTKARTAAAAAELRTRLDRALTWWADKPATTIKPATHSEFVVWRRAHTRVQNQAGRAGGAVGSRSADLELASLSSLCQWAQLTGRIKDNPFETREVFTEVDTITHCHLAMPDNDDQLHRVLSSFWNPYPVKKSEKTTVMYDPEPQRIVVGAWFAFSALTGLRPGEHQYLQRVPAATAFPPDLRTAPYGLIYPMPDGTRRMKVKRTKHGQNPAVLIHPALQDFLDYYLPWLNENYPLTPLCPITPLFPGLDGEWILGGYLRRACKFLGLKPLKPHGLGRAYYVRVRRSQGIDDSAIANELGQKSDGDLIRSVYGDPMDPVGGNLHDWIPSGPAAWHALALTADTASNIIAL